MNSYNLHPWHGIDTYADEGKSVFAFIEIVPADTMKYEIHKPSGWLMIDRPQLFSNHTPFMYGLVPRTYCGEGIARLAKETFGSAVEKGDGDPLDICVLSSKEVLKGGILLKAIPIGGLCLNDKGEADDKIIAVLKDDELYAGIRDISELPTQTLKRIEHYFLTYKNMPEQHSPIRLDAIYGADHARMVIERSVEDYGVMTH